MEIIIPALAIAALTTLGILLLITEYREYKYRKKIDFLSHLVERGYETENIDLNNL